MEGDGHCSYEACKGIETDSVNINKQTNKEKNKTRTKVVIKNIGVYIM